jgi:hypothetical protein
MDGGSRWAGIREELDQMDDSPDSKFYTLRQKKLLEDFDQQAEWWRQQLMTAFDEAFANTMVSGARSRFKDLLPTLPYIGGDKNHLTATLLDAGRCLALYQAMRAEGKTAAQTGKVLYDAILARGQQVGPDATSGKRLTEEELMERRRQRAERSQRRAYPDDWVYEFVPGDGTTFDYGYDFSQCAAQKLFHRLGAHEFLGFYCFLDFAASEVWGLGLTRSKTLADGDSICNHRFKRGRQTAWGWPPPFLRHPDDNR